MTIEFENIEVFSEDGLVRVDLEWNFEGIDGDYDASDSDDIPLLRYAVYRKFTKDCKNNADRLCDDFRRFKIGEWMEVDDSSYCTQLSALENRDSLIEAAQFILTYVQSGVRDFSHEKRLYELLSWVGIKDGVPYCEQSIVISPKG
jgi:hypothetical protein